MIYQKIKNETETELKEISLEEAFKLAGTGDVLAFDSQMEELEFYKEVIKRYPSYPSVNKEKQSDVSSLIMYLDDKELHEIVLSLINDEEQKEYQGLEIRDLVMYLNEKDVDLLFSKGLEGNLKINPVELAPYVSSKGFTAFVDEYVKGNYQDVDIDSLYPYMDSADIKRLLKYYLSKKR